MKVHDALKFRRLKDWRPPDETLTAGAANKLATRQPERQAEQGATEAPHNSVQDDALQNSSQQALRDCDAETSSLGEGLRGSPNMPKVREQSKGGEEAVCMPMQSLPQADLTEKEEETACFFLVMKHQQEA